MTMQGKCIDNRLTRRTIRYMAPKQPKKTKALRQTPLQIRLTEDEKKLFTEAAERQHLSLSSWIRLAALHAANSQHALG